MNLFIVIAVSFLAGYALASWGIPASEAARNRRAMEGATQYAKDILSDLGSPPKPAIACKCPQCRTLALLFALAGKGSVYDDPASDRSTLH